MIFHHWPQSVVLVSIAALLLSCAPPLTPATSPGAAEAPQARRGGVARIALWQEPLILNPLLGTQTVNALVSRTILDGLLENLPDGSYVPKLAAEVPSLENGGVSSDGLTVTWKLRGGVVWSDRQPFTSRDVAFTYNVIMNTANPITTRTGYPDIESVSTPDDTTALVKYRTLYAGFKSHFNWVLPEHVFGADTAIDEKNFNQAPLGTGPFVFKSWAPGDAIAVERNPHYREPGKPHLDGLVFRIVPARDVAILWLKTGDIDVLWSLVESNLPEVEAIPDVIVNPAPSTRVERLILNTSCPSGPRQGDPGCPHPVLGDIRVRQAIELAIDKKAIVDELLYGRASVATSVLPVGPYAAALSPSAYDPVRASQLLEEAGWRAGADSIRMKEGVRASLTYSTTTGDSLRDQTQQLVQAQLRGAGIELRIENFPSPILLGSWQDNAPRARGNFDIVMYTSSIASEPQAALYNHFHSSAVPTERTRSGQNYHRIVDPELDRALDVAGSTVDEAARRGAYKAALERVDAGKGHIVLYSRLDLDAFKTHVKGHAPNIWSSLTWNAAEWSIEK